MAPQRAMEAASPIIASTLTQVLTPNLDGPPIAAVTRCEMKATCLRHAPCKTVVVETSTGLQLVQTGRC